MPLNKGRIQGFWLGVDYGTKSVGLALGEGDSGLVVPLGVISVRAYDTDELVCALLRTCREREVTGVVMGLPLRTDGSELPLAAKVRDLASALTKISGLPVCFQDEHLSSFQADLLLQQKKKRNKADRDAIAAQIILQNFLDR